VGRIHEFDEGGNAAQPTPSDVIAMETVALIEQCVELREDLTLLHMAVSRQH
jgi:hypothetical protein